AFEPEPSAEQPRDQGDRTSWELQIGTRWTAWAGAIVVVVAMGFFVKLAFDQGWWGGLPEWVKCLMTGGVGAVLIGLGELALRRVGRQAAVGLFSAGIGTLYLTAYATFRYFNLVNDSVAFVLMALTAMIGFAITYRGRMLSIGVLSVVAGCMTPMLLQPQTTFAASFPLFLTVLLGVPLALSAFVEKPFRPLRYVAMVGVGMIGLLWALDEGRQHWLLALSFMSLWWGMITAEALYAARREQSVIGNVFASILSTAWYVSVTCFVLERVGEQDQNWLGIFTVIIALMAGLTATLFCGGVNVLRQAPRRAIEKMGVALWGQVGVLAAVAIALQFNQYGRNDYGQTIGWLAIALACIEIGRRLPSRGVDVFGLIMGGLALLRVTFVDRDIAFLHAEIWGIEGSLTITRWTVLALAAIAATHAASWRFRFEPFEPWRRMPIILAGLGVLGWFAVCALQCLELTITGAWLAATLVLLALEQVGRLQRYLVLSMIGLIATAGKWLVVDAALGRIDPAWAPDQQTPLLNWQMGLAVAIAATGWWLSRKLSVRLRAERAESGDMSESHPWQIALIGAAVMLLIGASFEIDAAVAALDQTARELHWPVEQLRQLLFTALWTLGAVGVGGLAVALGTRAARGTFAGTRLIQQFAWGLLLVCGIKWLVFDTLAWAVDPAELTGTPWPLLNLQMLVGVMLAAGGVVLFIVTGVRGLAASQLKQGEAGAAWLQWTAWLPVAASVVVLWGLTFEVERIIGRYEATFETGVSLWPTPQLRLLWWTLLWAVGGVAMLLYGRLHSWRPMFTGGWVVLLMSGLTWLTADTVAFRMLNTATPCIAFANVQFVIGVLVAGLLAAAIRFMEQSRTADAPRGQFESQALTTGLTCIAAIGLWAVSLEIDRFFTPRPGGFENAAMARQMVLSIFWGCYGIGLVAVGFAKRVAVCRYAGLGLLSLTLGKVLIVDMSNVHNIYRVLSLLGVGLLLVGTSVAYSKLSSRLLAPRGG
ncbi:MAG: DUF2339 domain-containing protein, partial [Planctomycetes bacterium]|nr:DUF2339 domain-containing protein [Planctomycetota bacterium]